MKQYFKEHKRGIISTIVFHIGLILFLMFMGFHIPLPLPGEEGILINFGESDLGSGDVEPPSSSASKPVEEHTSPPVEQTQVQTSVAEEEIITQDIEKTVAVESKKEVKPKEKSQEEIEAERKIQEEKEKKRIEEEKRLKQEEIERKRQEEEDKKAKANADMIKNSFGSGKNNDANNSTGEGNTSYKGNQGQTNGSVDSKNHGIGHGLGTNGNSWSLKGRKNIELPKPDYDIQEEGKVVVEIRVDSYGKVVSATPGKKGTTIQSLNLYRIAKEAALKAKFDAKPNSPDQIGTITYVFVLE